MAADGGLALTLLRTKDDGGSEGSKTILRCARRLVPTRDLADDRRHRLAARWNGTAGGWNRDKLSVLHAVFEAAPDDSFRKKSGYPNDKTYRVTNRNQPHHFVKVAVTESTRSRQPRCGDPEEKIRRKIACRYW